jgi:hypothetical protein
MTRWALVLLAPVVAACGSPSPSTAQTAAAAGRHPTGVSRDSASAALVPPNYGTLRQEDVLDRVAAE